MIHYPSNNLNNPNYMDIFRYHTIYNTTNEPRVVEIINTGLTYTGYSLPGVLAEEPFWRIQEKTTSDDDITWYKYSNTGSTFTDIWNERTGYTYY